MHRESHAVVNKQLQSSNNKTSRVTRHTSHVTSHTHQLELERVVTAQGVLQHRAVHPATRHVTSPLPPLTPPHLMLTISSAPFMTPQYMLLYLHP